MAAPPYEQPGANIAFSVLFGLFALGEYAMRVRSRLNRSGTRAERWSLVIVVMAVIGGLLGGLGLASWHAMTITVGRWPFFIVGLALMASGIYVRQWAICTLGRFFTADVRVHSQQTVVDRGPYRWVRHPSYSGLIIFFLGLGLALTNWMSLLVLVAVPTAGLVLRIHSEERALLAGLGEPYRRCNRRDSQPLPPRRSPKPSSCWWPERVAPNSSRRWTSASTSSDSTSRCIRSVDTFGSSVRGRSTLIGRFARRHGQTIRLGDGR